MTFDEWRKKYPEVDWNSPRNGEIEWQAAMAYEREECAKLCDAEPGPMAWRLAIKIRSRGVLSRC